MRTGKRIRAREVRLLGPEKEPLGILSLDAALAKAAEYGLDLVEINPSGKPPVCKIMDLGKWKYEEKKKEAEARRNRTVVKVKEIKLRPRTEEHDYQTRMKQVREFLEEGHKVKIIVVFQGRELAHREIGMKQLQDVTETFKDLGVVEQAPRMEGRNLSMLIAGKPS